jgi:hypothetical protein
MFLNLFSLEYSEASGRDPVSPIFRDHACQPVLTSSVLANGVNDIDRLSYERTELLGWGVSNSMREELLHP